MPWILDHICNNDFVKSTGNFECDRNTLKEIKSKYVQTGSDNSLTFSKDFDEQFKKLDSYISGFKDEKDRQNEYKKNYMYGISDIYAGKIFSKKKSSRSLVQNEEAKEGQWPWYEKGSS